MILPSLAPYKAIKKTVRRLSENEAELTCESQGFPLARVTWTDGKLREPHLTNRSESSHAINNDGAFVVTSRLSVKYDANNYTCSYTTRDSKASQAATFRIPGGCEWWRLKWWICSACNVVQLISASLLGS